MTSKKTLLIATVFTCKSFMSLAQINNDDVKFEQILNFNQLNSSIVQNLYGLQSKSNFQIIKQIELLNTATYLLGQKQDYFMNDIRLCFAGPNAQKWHPALGAELGYVFLKRDFLAPKEVLNQHGFVFGGDWDFPLKILTNGHVIAKWGYVIIPHAKDMTIFNCFVHWNLSKKIGFYCGGDIYKKLGGNKYSGFVIGLSFTSWKKINI